MRVVSKRQREVYNFIARFIKVKGYSPKIRDIAGRFGFSSPASVHKYLVTLEQAGLIVRGKRNALVQLSAEKDTGQEIVKIPVLGIIKGGSPIVWVKRVKSIKNVKDLL